MKRLLFITGLTLLMVQAWTQTVPRNMVILEIGTGTWCTYCPGSANAADQLVAEGKSVAVIEYHNGDPYVNTASNARNSYYGITGYPTANFDGGNTFVGGQACPSGNVYSSYLPLYTQQINTPSPLSICLSGSNAGNNYTINVTVNKVGTVTGTSLRLHLVLTESNIATAPWPAAGCMNEVNFVERLMVPDQNGTSFSFGTGNVQTFTLNFTKDPTWVAAECELVCFVQDNATKVIYNGCKTALTTLPSTMMTLTDFTGTPTSGCTPLLVNFSAVATGVTQYTWAFQGGTPSSSTQPTPAVTYNASGSFNVGLKVSNGVCKDSLGKTAYITVAGSPGIPGQPQGPTSMCVNPPNSTYTTSGALYATSYNWSLTPASAGVLTNNGTSCLIDWDDVYTGTAQLKVQGVSSCGTGPWSGTTSISISTPPSQPGIPAGPTALCLNPPNTDYTTTGATGATAYQWDLTPANAGTVASSGTTATVYWSDAYVGSAQLKVSAFNGGCQGPWSDVLNITIYPYPVMFNVTGGGPYCGLGGNGSPVGLDNSETGMNYTLFLDGSATTNTVPGTGSAISFGNQMAAGLYTVQGVNASGSCTNNMTGSATVTIDPEPPFTPGEPTGPGHVYTGATPTTDYLTTGGQYSTSYTWNITPAAAGTIAGASTVGTVTWDQTYSGLAEIKVQGVNSCGGGSFSTILEVTVDVGVGIPGINENPAIRLYPNPANNTVLMTSAIPGNAVVTLFTSFGKRVLDLGSVNLSGPVRIDVSGLSAGIYLVKVSTTDRTENLKLIVE